MSRHLQNKLKIFFIAPPVQKLKRKRLSPTPALFHAHCQKKWGGGCFFSVHITSNDYIYMGRPIKSTEEHIKDGTYRKDRHENRGVSLDALKEISIPEELNNAAKKKWLEIVPTLQENGLITIVDIPTITDAFIQYGAAQDCLNTVMKSNSSIAEYWSKLNKFKDVDLIAKYNESMDIYKRTMEKYGVTPAGRAKIKLQPKKEDEGDNFIKSLRGNG